MRLSKQIDQIFQLANEFHDDESDPVGMAMDELPDGVGVIVLDGILTDFYSQLLVQDGISDEC